MLVKHWGVSVALLWSLAFASSAAAEPGAPSGLLCDLLEHPQETVITTAVPRFGWIYHPSFRDDVQSGYRIIVASSKASARLGAGDLWDSGVVRSEESINVPYAGRPLQRDTDYYWRVQTRDGAGRLSPWSAIEAFRTDGQLTSPEDSPWHDPEGVPFQGLFYKASSSLWANRNPLHFVAAEPVLVTNTAPGRWFVDFGQDAFGCVALHLAANEGGKTVEAEFGEMARGLAVDAQPPAMSSVRYANVSFSLSGHEQDCVIRPPLFPTPYSWEHKINPPGNYGPVMPFRYFELLNFPGTLAATEIVQERLECQFDTNASSFASSSAALDQVWELCKHSLEFGSFDGIYVDGDRERTPYEADAYIHQLSAYAVDREWTMPRYTFEYLLVHPTWPTEWKFHMIFIAWADYQETGNADLLYRYYDALKADTLTWAATGDGLIKGFPNYPQTTNSDVVDWPPADRDGFVIKCGQYLNWTNAVNNAFYYGGLETMSKIAGAIGREEDARKYAAMAGRVYSEYNRVFWDSNTESYVDGVGTRHSSAHANFFPLAFGLVPAERQGAVVRYIHRRIAADGGMPASVYGAQYLLEGLFEAGDTDTALELMTTNGPRGWLNMINMGSTLTTEAWNFEDKPNMDWNHCWGAAPANLISRFVLGVQPLSPGYGHILIQPHLGSVLSYVNGKVPTIRGPVRIEIRRTRESYHLVVNIPGNVVATIMLPAGGNNVALLDGQQEFGILDNGRLTLKNIGPGRHVISVAGAEMAGQVKSEKKEHGRKRAL